MPKILCACNIFLLMKETGAIPKMENTVFNEHSFIYMMVMFRIISAHNMIAP